ncbi:cytochrome P450 3A8-like [Oppia nitens]|uniref:cytochrome P450 3A8-like n=1 Tax=Oppia nitens TaxID=1686743 RepID=UPI0023DA3497|nr:cytochrome P450 3A8-like [Oppia nitens]
MLSIVSIIFISTVLTFIYKYFNRHFDYWSKRGITGPKPVIGFGNNLPLIWRTRADVDFQRMKKYGHIYGYFYGDLPILITTDPNLIKQICLNDWPNFVNRSNHVVQSSHNHPILCHNIDEAQDTDWKRIRSIMSTAFTSAKSRSMMPKVRQCLKQLTTVMDRYAASGHTIDMLQMYKNTMMDIVAASVYSLDLNSAVNPNHPFIININQILDPKWYRTLALILLPQFVLNLIGMKQLTDDTSNEYFFQLTRHIISQRKASTGTGSGGNGSSGKRWDFVELLMDAHAIEDQTINDNNKTTEDNYRLYEKGMTKYLTEDEVIANAWFLINGGYDVTVVTLSFATFELACNQSVQQKLYDEIMTVVITNDDNDQQLDVDRLHNLPLLEAVVCETLRLHSPTIMEGRIAKNDYPLGGRHTGITLRAGETIEFGIYAMHMNADYYPNPEQFNVDRFLPENRNQLTPYAFLPFGLGPRQCIAKRFAQMLVKLTLATLVLKYRFNTCEQTDIPTKVHISSFSNAPKCINLKIESPRLSRKPMVRQNSGH